MREREGQRWCMYHPDQTAPDMDLISGKLRGADGKPKERGLAIVSPPARSRPRRAAKPTKAPAAPRVRRQAVVDVELPPEPKPSPVEAAEAYDVAGDLVLQAELEELERTDPTVAAAAASYDAMADRIRTRPAPPVRPPRSPDIDPLEAARRYQAGEGLASLATDLHIGVTRLRKVLAEQGVQIRSRGDVIGQRGALPRPIDEDECERLYREGMNSHEVARHLRVKQSRVRAVLRKRGVLRTQPGTLRPLDVDEARRLYATGLTVAEVGRMLGVRISRVADVLREVGELRPKSRRADGGTA